MKYMVKNILNRLAVGWPALRRGNATLLLALSFAVLAVLAVLMASGVFSTTSAGTQQAGSERNLPIAVQASPVASGVQEVSVRALETGVYDQPLIKVQANKPVRLRFSADANAGCGAAFVMRDFGIQLVSRNGEEKVAEFTPPPGRFEYSCSMRMFRGVLEAS